MSYRIVGRVDGSPESIEALFWALDEAVVRPKSELSVPRVQQPLRASARGVTG
jgi:hypothetical protein